MILRLKKQGEVGDLWRTETMLSFDALTIHAAGWKLLDFHIGAHNVYYMQNEPEGLALFSPVRMVAKGEVAQYIDVILVPNAPQAETPFVVIEPRQTSADMRVPPGFLGEGNIFRRKRCCCCCHHGGVE